MLKIWIFIWLPLIIIVVAILVSPSTKPIILEHVLASRNSESTFIFELVEIFEAIGIVILHNIKKNLYI